MIYDGKIWAANTEAGEKVCILPSMANRHGLIAGATGTGKTITLKVLAETFSEMGVPVFLADVKGDLAGMIEPGRDSEDMQARIERFGLAEAGFEYQKYPAAFWDIYGINGIQLRTTISEMGPLLMARILRLNDLQTDILSIVFKIADDQKLLLVDTKDLKSMLNYVDENVKDFQADYGRISTASIGAIMRALVALELDGGDKFFGEPALAIRDLMKVDENGKGMINILDSQTLINNGRLYSTFLLWLIAELFEELPEVGDPEKPKMVFFFDEAHLLFDGASKALLEKIDQVVKLIRSKGIGIYFVTQNPKDVPDSVLAQLGNKVQHALRAYTPTEQKAVRAAASSFRENPAFDTYDTLIGLGTGQAVVSFLDEKGTPGMAQKVNILPPKSRMGSISAGERDASVRNSVLYDKYAVGYDPDSAYEFLLRRGKQLEAEAAKAAQQAEEAKAAAAEAKLAEKEAERAAREAEREAKAKENAKKRAIKSVGNSAAGTVGREIGKAAGKKFGAFGKTFGGNVGASLARGIFQTIASWFGK